MPESRHLAVLDGDRRLDVTVPFGATLADVLGGLAPDEVRPGVPLLDGRAADLQTVVADLEDGAMVAVVDPAAELAVRPEHRAEQRPDTGGRWWAQAGIGMVLVALAASRPMAQLVPGLVVGACAVTSAVAAARQTARDGSGASARALGPLTFAVAAVVFLVPRSPAGDAQLAVLGSGLAGAVLLLLAVVVVPSASTRSAWAACVSVILAVAAVWGVVLLLGWDVSLAAAVTAGAVPVALRALPSGLLNVPDGYFVDVARFMDARWTVRGTVASVVPTADGHAVRARVDGAAAAQVAGTVLLCGIGSVALPFAVPTGPAGSVVLGGRIALLVTYASALVLMGRTRTVHAMGWVPRAAALVPVAVGARLLVARVGTAAALPGAAGAFLAGLVAVGVVLLVGRGARSLVLSRVADAWESAAVALCLPVALLAGGAIDAIRATVAA